MDMMFELEKNPVELKSKKKREDNYFSKKINSLLSGLWKGDFTDELREEVLQDAIAKIKDAEEERNVELYWLNEETTNKKRNIK